MKTNATAVYLKHTHHVLAAFTRKGVTNGDLSEEDLQALFANRLAVRFLKQTSLEPRKIADDRQSAAVGHPVRKRAAIDFMIEARDLAAFGQSIEEIGDAPYLTRPADFTVNVDEDHIGATPKAPAEVDYIKHTVEFDGLTVEIGPKTGKAIAEDIPVWALLRLQPDGLFVSQHAEIPKNSNLGTPTGVKIPLTAIPQADAHQVLLLVQGSQPIWDELKVGEGRKWTNSP